MYSFHAITVHSLNLTPNLLLEKVSLLNCGIFSALHAGNKLLFTGGTEDREEWPVLMDFLMELKPKVKR